MGFQLSPGVQTKEIDLSTSIPAVATSLGATVGRFTWGPVDEPYLCTSENDLVSVFGKPTNDTYPAFLSAAAFLGYSNSLQVVRVVDAGANNASNSGGVEQIKNAEDFETQLASGTLTEGFYARYPGTYGNGISVHTQNGVDGWDTWQYKDSFDVQPDSTNNELAVAIVVGGEVVEKYLVSNVEGTKDISGNNIWMEERINAMSKLVWTVSANVNATTVAASCSDVAYTDEATCVAASETWTAADPSAEAITFTGGLAMAVGVDGSCESLPIIEQFVANFEENDATNPLVAGQTDFSIASWYDAAASGTVDNIATVWYNPANGALNQLVEGVDYTVDEDFMGFVLTTPVGAGDTIMIIFERWEFEVYDDKATCLTPVNVWHETVSGYCSDSIHTTEATCIAHASEGVTWTDTVPAHCEDTFVDGVNANGFTTEAQCHERTKGLWTEEIIVGTVGANDYINGWDKLANADEIDVNLLIAGGVNNEPKATAYAVQKYIVENIAEVRKDCMAILSPAKEDVVNVGGATNAVNNVIASRKAVSFNVASSYAAFDGSYKYTYDKYNDTYRWIAFSGDVAGLMANTDNVRDAWWSPAGLNRGVIKNVVKLAYNPTAAHRDQLYKLPNGINPIVSFPGQGTVLWGDRTMLIKPSAFDRINVRRLFIVIEKAIAISAKYFLFEFNNAFTRNNFNNQVNPYLAGLQNRQAMTDFYVECNATNNTPEVVDANEFVASIYIKPSKSINFITLNFVATKSGVAFSEVIGQV